MGVKIRQKREKRRKNAAYAARFPRRDKEQKKWERRQLTIKRQRRALEERGMERDDRWPLVV